MENTKQEITDIIAPCVKKCVAGTLEDAVSRVMNVLDTPCTSAEELNELLFTHSIHAYFRDLIGSRALQLKIVKFIGKKKGNYIPDEFGRF